MNTRKHKTRDNITKINQKKTHTQIYTNEHTKTKDKKKN